MNLIIRLLFVLVVFSSCYMKPILRKKIEDVSISPGDYYYFEPPLTTFSSRNFIQYSVAHDNSFIETNFSEIGERIGDFEYTTRIDFSDYQVKGNLMFACGFRPGDLVIFNLSSETNFSRTNVISRTKIEDVCFGLAADFDNWILYLTCDKAVISIDVSKPKNPEIIDFLYVDFYGFSQNKRLPVLSNDTLYFCGYQGLNIFNISNPSNLTPIVVDFKWDEDCSSDCLHIALSENELLYISSTDCGLSILNISDLHNVSLITSFLPRIDAYYPNVPLWDSINQIQISSKDPNILFLSGTEYYFGHGFAVLNVSDPFNISLVFMSSSGIQHGGGFSIVDEDFLCLSSNQGINVFNISDPFSIKEISTMDNKFYISPMSRGVRIEGKYLFLLGNTKLYQYSNYHLTMDDYFPTFIFDISNKSNLVIACEECAPISHGNNYIKRMKASNDIAYAISDVHEGKGCCNNWKHKELGVCNFITFLNISSEMSHLSRIGRKFFLPIGEFLFDVTTNEEDTLLFIGMLGKFCIYNISDIYNINKILCHSSSFQSQERIGSLLLENNLLYCFASIFLENSKAKYLYIMNVTDIINDDITIVGSVLLETNGFYIYSSFPLKVDEYIYLSLGTDFTRLYVVIDVSNPSLPIRYFVSAPDRESYSKSKIVRQGEYLYLSDVGILEVISISNRLFPVCVYKEGLISYGIAVTYSDIAVFSQTCKIISYNFSNKTCPTNSESVEVGLSLANLKDLYLFGNQLIVYDVTTETYGRQTLSTWEFGRIKLFGIPNNTTDCGDNFITLHSNDGSEKNSLVFNVYVDCMRCFGILHWKEDTVCSGHGKCVQNDTCDCDENYFGKTCNITTCFGMYNNVSSLLCGSHGFCGFYEICGCSYGWFGSLCDLDITILQELIEKTNQTMADRMNLADVKMNTQKQNLGTDIMGFVENQNQMISNEIFLSKNTSQNEMNSMSNDLTQFLNQEIQELDSKCSDQLNLINITHTSRIFNEMSVFVDKLNMYLLSTCKNIISTDPTVCNGRGICVRKTNEEVGRCFCSDGFGGDNCEIDHDESVKSFAESSLITSGSFAISTSIFLFMMVFSFFVAVIFLIICCIACCCGIIAFRTKSIRNFILRHVFRRKMEENSDDDDVGDTDDSMPNCAISRIREHLASNFRGISGKHATTTCSTTMAESTDGEWISSEDGGVDEDATTDVRE